MKYLPLVSILLLGGCSSTQQPAETAPVVVTDTEPVGDGLKTLAYAFLGASVVLTLGRLLR